ncbi:hypothetical protein JCM17960_33610 [Magnetospira thiophila]
MAHLIAYHKQATSARMRFLRYASGSICGPEPLASPAQLVDEVIADSGDPAIVAHPAPLKSSILRALGLTTDDLEVEGTPLARVDVAGGAVTVYAAAFTTLDPPFDAAEQAGAKFIELAQARGLPSVELELLRLVFERAVG